MARYYFDTHDGALIKDDEGIECSSFQEIMSHALSGLADFANDAVPGATSREMAVKVRDHEGRPVVETILRLEIEHHENADGF